MTAPIDTSFDFQGLAALKSAAQAQDPAALKEAAKQFESLFTQMLLKSMRDSNRNFGDSLFGGEQADLYQDMFDDQIALQLSKGKGLGLADMLVQQLTRAGLAPATTPPSATTDTVSVPNVQHSSKTGSTSHQPLTTSKADFVRSLWPHAERAGRELGVDPHALLAQAALETGWGKSVPCDASGACSFNLFGIKAGTQWSGATVNVPTLEFEEGVAVRRVERFRSYTSPADSFRDYAGLIRNSARYDAALNAGTDVASFAAALQKGGYATDPNYARKIVAIADELQTLTGGFAPEGKRNPEGIPREVGPLKFEPARPLSDTGAVRT